MKVYRKLGFTHLETAEIVTSINKLLSNYHVHYQKLRKFHWEVEGSDFFDLHNLFEEEYNQVQTNIDDLAERIRVFGKMPLGTLQDYLENSEIEEVYKSISAYAMVREILKDYEVLLTYMMEVKEAAENIGDSSTEDLIVQMVKRMEKRHWMFTAWSKKTKAVKEAEPSLS